MIIMVFVIITTVLNTFAIISTIWINFFFCTTFIFVNCLLLFSKNDLCIRIEITTFWKPFCVIPGICVYIYTLGLYIYITLGLIGRDSGLSTLCHSCGFPCQQRVLKTFPGPGYLHSEDGVVWLCHLFVNLYMKYIYMYFSFPTFCCHLPACQSIRDVLYQWFFLYRKWKMN